jgi:23S rRNA pseudoU1915 N3-methylase RlmH
VELVLLAVGKLRPSYREACDDYLRRLSRYLKVREVEVREASRAPTVVAQRAEEGELRPEEGPLVLPEGALDAGSE